MLLKKFEILVLFEKKKSHLDLYSAVPYIYSCIHFVPIKESVLIRCSNMKPTN